MGTPAAPVVASSSPLSFNPCIMLEMRRGIGTWIRTFAFWSFIVPSTILLSLLALGISLFDSKGNFVHRVARFWARLSLVASGVRVAVEGVSNIPQGPAVFMSNHQSAFDIFIILAYLPVQFRWLAKASLFKIPFLGWAMARARYIAVERENPREATKGFLEAIKRVREGTSVVIFPEGTRSRDGSLLPFRKGGFTLALKAQVPIVPMAIGGTDRVMPKGGYKVRGGKVTLKVGPFIETRGMAPRDCDYLMAQVREAIERLKEEAEGWLARLG